MSGPVTILDCAIAAGAKPSPTYGNSYTAEELSRFGFAMLGGCAGCGESLAAYNAHPSRGGLWACKQCIGDGGFESTAAFQRWQAEQDARERMRRDARSVQRGYGFGVQWIADNDEPEDLALDSVESMVTVALLADLFGRETHEVAADVVAVRRRREVSR